MEQIKITQDLEQQKFILKENGYIAFINYVLKNDKMYLTHSEVPDALRGQGIGFKLVEGTFDYLMKNNLKVVIRCPFIDFVAKKNPKYNEIILQ